MQHILVFLWEFEGYTVRPKLAMAVRKEREGRKGGKGTVKL